MSITFCIVVFHCGAIHNIQFNSFATTLELVDVGRLCVHYTLGYLNGQICTHTAGGEPFITQKVHCNLNVSHKIQQ